jgi:hypothetical protein
MHFVVGLLCCRTEQVEEAAAQLRELRARLPTLSGRERGLGHRDASILAGQVAAVREEVVAEVLKGAQVRRQVV